MKKAMTWLLLVLGLLLMALGSAFLYNGFGLIEIERGAAQTSAGASLLAGGVVTLGLSVILMQLQEALTIFVDRSPASIFATTTPTETATSLPLMAAGGLAGAGAGAAVAAGAAGLSGLMSQHTDVGPNLDVPELMAVQEVSEPSLHAQAAHLVSAPDADVAPALTLPRSADAGPRAAIQALDAIAPEIPHSPPGSVAAEILPEALLPGPPTLVEPVEASDDQAADDWFERMFAETAQKPHLAVVQEGTEVGHPPVSAAPTPVADTPMALSAAPHPEPASQNKTVAPQFEHGVQSQPAPAPVTPPARPGEHASEHTAAAQVHPASEVVARHEADGITYIMYADGSIDADDGVNARRFASMEELAASIKD